VSTLAQLLIFTSLLGTGIGQKPKPKAGRATLSKSAPAPAKAAIFFIIFLLTSLLATKNRHYKAVLFTNTQKLVKDLKLSMVIKKSIPLGMLPWAVSSQYLFTTKP